MNKIFAGVLLAGAALAPMLASADTIGPVVDTFEGKGYGPTLDAAHQSAQRDAHHKAAAAGFGRCVEQFVNAQHDGSLYYVISVQECVAL
ncbi:hypothetical protein [Stenotrophomonas sp.]|uniref:hypothetical protein n=1 Tax=Stenotrophomonas sp. TaxID=69392 RepID=UPI002899D24C|nr:hypothetical protein [Stenotrophomonas sp.]